MTRHWREPDSNPRSRGKPRPAFGYSLLIMKSLSAADSAPETSPLRPASCRTFGAAFRQRKGFEPLGFGIEAQHRVCSPVADPHGIGVIDVDSVGLRPVARQTPALPTIVPAVVAEEVSAVPIGNPQPAAAVAPDAPCALPTLRLMSAGRVSR